MLQQEGMYLYHGQHVQNLKFGDHANIWLSSNQKLHHLIRSATQISLPVTGSAALTTRICGQK
jgi:hypothetical protein